jgi:hypothetical protein
LKTKIWEKIVVGKKCKNFHLFIRNLYEGLQASVLQKEHQELQNKTVSFLFLWISFAFPPSDFWLSQGATCTQALPPSFNFFIHNATI